MDAKAEKLALFRYGLIAPLVLETLPRGELTRRAEEIAARQYDIPDSQRISVSVDTLLEWALRYRQGGFDALAPKPRQDRGQSRAITPQLADLIERLKRVPQLEDVATSFSENGLSAYVLIDRATASRMARLLRLSRCADAQGGRLAHQGRPRDDRHRHERGQPMPLLRGGARGDPADPG